MNITHMLKDVAFNDSIDAYPIVMYLIDIGGTLALVAEGLKKEWAW